MLKIYKYKRRSLIHVFLVSIFSSCSCVLGFHATKQLRSLIFFFFLLVFVFVKEALQLREQQNKITKYCCITEFKIVSKPFHIMSIIRLFCFCLLFFFASSFIFLVGKYIKHYKDLYKTIISSSFFFRSIVCVCVDTGYGLKFRLSKL